MSEEQLCRLPSELVAIGSHTMTHAFLPSIDKQQLREEVAGSRTRLEKLLKRPVNTFSFPYGAFNDSVVEECREAGYERVFTALPVFGVSQPREFVTGRVGTGPMDWPIEFRLKLAGAYRWLPYAFELKRRVKSAIRGGAAKPGALKTAEKRRA